MDWNQDVASLEDVPENGVGAIPVQSWWSACNSAGHGVTHDK